MGRCIAGRIRKFLAHARARAFIPREGEIEFRRFASENDDVRAGSSATSYGSSLFPLLSSSSSPFSCQRDTSTERCGLLLSAPGRFSARRRRRNRWRRKNNALSVDSCTPLCRQFAKIELSVGVTCRYAAYRRRARDFYSRDEKSRRRRKRVPQSDREGRKRTSLECSLVVRSNNAL